MQAERTERVFYCSLHALETGEPLLGTASQGQVWFLLEYSLAWETKAFESSLLPEAVKAHLSTAVRHTPGSRVLMIKRRRSLLERGVHFYAAISSETAPRLYRFHLDQITDLLALDLAGIVQGSPDYDPAITRQPLLLVCTNGKRDACCATFGLPVYDALRQADALEPERISVWQSSHLGGHRFAPNVVAFPEGIYYGRLQPEQALALRQAHLRGEIDLDHLRGRACYPKIVQAAEALLRAETGRLGLEEYLLQSTAEEPEGIWRVTFVSRMDASVQQVRVRTMGSGERVRTGCFTTETEEIVRYELLGITSEEPAEPLLDD